MTQEGSQTENGEVLLTPFGLTEGTSTRAKTAESYALHTPPEPK
jgi:hypothetical protein